MNIERFTEKAQDALRSAQRLTTKFGQQETEVEHLLLALLDQDNGLATAVLNRAGVSVDAVRIRLQRELEKLPRVSGGNTAVFITDSGVTLVDTKLPGYGQTILDRVKTVTNKPITRIINTHSHPDHLGSNQEIDTALGGNVQVVVQAKTAARMAADG